MALIGSVEAEVAPDASFLAKLEVRPRAIAPALMQEAKLAKSDPQDRLAELTALLPTALLQQDEADNPGLSDFKPSRDPSKSYRVSTTQRYIEVGEHQLRPSVELLWLLSLGVGLRGASKSPQSNPLNTNMILLTSRLYSPNFRPIQGGP